MMKMIKMFSMLMLALGVSASVAASQLDPNLPVYEKISGVSGKLTSVGSDTLANLMTLWAEEYKKLYPSVSIQIQAAGSSTAPPALTESTSNFGPMSRKMKSTELVAFEKKHGYKPVAIPVAIDAIAVYVHKDNPIKSMTLPQVDAVFSSTRKCGHSANINTWGQLGLTGFWTKKGVQVYGRNSVSGTYGYFKKVALCKGDYKKTVNEQPGSAAVVQSVSVSLDGIGYSGIGYRTASVRTVPIAKKTGGIAYNASPENALSGQYPISRFLYIYVNKKPNSELPPLEKQFMKMVLSKVGQEVVVKDGYVPLTSPMSKKFMKLLD